MSPVCRVELSIAVVVVNEDDYLKEELTKSYMLKLSAKQNDKPETFSPSLLLQQLQRVTWNKGKQLISYKVKNPSSGYLTENTVALINQSL